MLSLSILLIFMPVLVALYGLYICLRIPYLGEPRRSFRLLASETIIYFFFVTVTLTPDAPASWVVAAQLGNEMLGPFIQATLISILYIWYHRVNHLPHYMYLWFSLPLAFFAASAMLCWVAGYSNVTYFRYLCDLQRGLPSEFVEDRLLSTIYQMNQIQDRFLLFAYILCTISYGVMILRRTGYSVKTYRKFRHQRKPMKTLHIAIICVFHAVFFVLIGLTVGRYSLKDHTLLAGLINMAIAWNVFLIVQCIKLIGHREVTMRQLLQIDAIPQTFEVPKDQPFLAYMDAIDEEEELEKEESDEANVLPEGVTLDDAICKRLEAALKVAFEEKQVYLQTGLKVEDLAHIIGTNRFYLSRYINEVLGQTFTELISRYRIEFAKQYMDANHFDSIERIASLSGFRSVQAFSRKFKELENMTPSEWYTIAKNK